MANGKSSWWGVLVALLTGLIIGFSACKFNWLRSSWTSGEPSVVSPASSTNETMVMKPCPVCPVCAPVAQPQGQELSCKAPEGWEKKLVVKKPISKKRNVPAKKPPAPTAPVAEAKPASPAPDLATAIKNAPAASKRPDSKTYVNELPKVSGCVRQTPEGEKKC